MSSLAPSRVVPAPISSRCCRLVSSSASACSLTTLAPVYIVQKKERRIGWRVKGGSMRISCRVKGGSKRKPRNQNKVTHKRGLVYVPIGTHPFHKKINISHIVNTQPLYEPTWTIGLSTLSPTIPAESPARRGYAWTQGVNTC